MSEKLSDLTHKSAVAEALFSTSTFEVKTKSETTNFQKIQKMIAPETKANSPRLQNSEFTF